MKKYFYNSLIYIVLLLLSGLLAYCTYPGLSDSEIEEINAMLRQLPVVVTSSPDNITVTSAVLGGNVTYVGEPAYTERGVCYSTSQNPTTNNTKLAVSGGGTGSYTVNATGLSENTTYYVRAYAVNTKGTAYGAQVSFTTQKSGTPSGSGTYTANGVSFDMISVPGGTTILNSTSVTMSNFSIGKTEVTQELWQAVMGSNPSYFSGSNKPVETVSWNDIVGIGSTTGYTVNGVSYKTDGFCYKLSQLVGGGKQFVLPTEAQWQYAAKGGQQTHNYTYSGSNTLGEVGWYWDNIPSQNSGYSGYGTQPVGTKLANELGIYDMSGNVWEWCSDWYGSSYPSSTSNPTGAASGSSRVFRGGGWNDYAENCTVSNRYGINRPGYRSISLGLRLALAL